MGHFPEIYGFRVVKILCLIGLMGLAVCCSGGSNNDDRGPDDPLSEIDSMETVDSTETVGAPGALERTLFTVIGDVPYNEGQRDSLVAMIEAHNANADSEFVIHVGDIKPGADDCDETVYEDVSGLLRNFTTPTFIILGDNEYNDCDNPEGAMTLWNQYFLNFHEQWEDAPVVDYQEDRPENFAWAQNGILFLGLNLVGSSVHDENEWNQRLRDNADWVEQQFNEHGEEAEATVVFGHANMTELGPEKFALFTDRFRAAAEDFEKPVLYLHGDGHFWFRNRPWPEQNILRVQIQGGSEAVQVAVIPGKEESFVFDRNFLK